MNNMLRKIIIRQYGLCAYEPVWRAMQTFTSARSASTIDEIWCLQHEPVYTQGQAGKPEHLLRETSIPVLPIDRGGQITYHGPGQLIVYTLIDLQRRNLGVRNFVTCIEQSVINLLADRGVMAHRKKHAPGVYVQEAKIAAIGLRVRHGCSFHGLSINVDMDLKPFLAINPCGYAGLTVTQTKDVCGESSLEAVQKSFLAHFFKQLGYTDVSYSSEAGVLS